MAEVLKETLLQFLCCHPDSTCKKNISTEHFITWNKRPFLCFWKEKEEKQKLLDHINQLQVKIKPEEPMQCFKYQLFKYKII